MSKIGPEQKLALEAAARRKLVNCKVANTKVLSGGAVEVIVSGSLDVDLEGAVMDGHSRNDVSSLIGNMRLQVTVDNGQVTAEKWLR